jgi:hypothetical protein
MNQTCFGRNGGFAPMIFPLFHGMCFEVCSTVVKTSVLETSSVIEVGHSEAGSLQK